MTPTTEQPRLTRTHGFTLVELLVATALSMIIMLAVLGFLNLVLNDQLFISDSVEADQHGRAALLAITQELHSACVGPNVTPVKSGESAETDGVATSSTATELDFISTYAETAQTAAPVFAANGGIHSVQLHKLTYSNGTITDTEYPAVSGNAPTWVFSTTPDEKATLLTDASPTGTTPIFQYLRYYNSSDAHPEYGVLNPSPLSTSPHLTTSEAQTVADIIVTFTANPVNGNTTKNRPDELATAVNLRLTPPSTATGATNLPCQ